MAFFYDGNGVRTHFTKKSDAGYETYYYRYNLQGDVIALLNNAGTVVAEYNYTAYGKPIGTVSEIGNLNPFRYRGYYYDNETGFYYLQSRYYDPTNARFINADAADYIGATGTPLSYNLFLYCENDPVNKIDENGNIGTPIQWAMAMIGSLVGWYFGDFVARRLGYTKGLKYWAIRSGVVVGGAVIGWFVGSTMIAIVKSFLLANPGTLLRLPSWVVNFFGLQSTYKVVVIGETMLRVTAYAKSIGASVYAGLHFYDKLVKIFGTKIAKIIGGIDNALWIIKKMIDKYHIVDIGIYANRATRSPYYLMESILTFFYNNKSLVKRFLK